MKCIGMHLASKFIEDTSDFFLKCDLKLRTVDGPLETKIKQTIDGRTNPVAKYNPPSSQILKYCGKMCGNEQFQVEC